MSLSSGDPVFFAGPEEPPEITGPLEAMSARGVNDYQFYAQAKSILIQRKVCPEDFYASWVDGRLARNEVELLENCDQGGVSYFLLEGQLRYNRSGLLLVNGRWTKITSKQVSNRLVSMQEKGIRLLLSPDIKETVRILAALYTWWQQEHSSLRSRPGPESLWGRATKAQRVLWVYQGFDGVGPELGKSWWQITGTLRTFMSLGEKAMLVLPGMGPVRVKSIRETLDMPYPERWL